MSKRVLPNKSDIPIAYKVLCVTPGLSPAAICIGAILISHFNRKTGRCDPSGRRLAELSGFSRSIVKKATRDLVVAGLFEKESHGGTYNTCSYQPIWGAFAKLNEIWQERFDFNSKVRKSDLSRSDRSPVEGPEIQTQTKIKTNKNNPKKYHLLKIQRKNDAPDRVPTELQVDQTSMLTNTNARSLETSGLQRIVVQTKGLRTQLQRRDIVSDLLDRATSRLFEKNPELYAIYGLAEEVTEAERRSPGSGKPLIANALLGLAMK